MKNDVLTLIKDNYSGFSKGQKKISDFLLSHYEAACYMTAFKIGETVGVSESTVVRFACQLGFEGFPEFQKELQEVVKSRLNNIQRIQVSADRFGDNILEDILARDIEMIRQTSLKSSSENFNKAVNAIVNAKNIYIIGTRSSSSLADFLSYYLGLFIGNVKLIQNANSNALYEQLFRIGKDDILIAISFPRYSNTTVKAIQFAFNNGAKTLAITDSNYSPLIEYATLSLLAHTDMLSFVDSLVAPLSVINALIVAISEIKQVETEKSFEMLEQIWDKYDTYHQKSGEKHE